MKAVIREYRHPADYGAVRALWEGMERGIHLGASDSASELEKKLQRDPELFLVAEVAAQVVGAVLGGFDGRRGLIYHLAVAAPQRGQGIGSRLMAEVEGRLRARGCLKCYLMVTRDNPDVIAYYEDRGWEAMDGVFLFGKEFA
jgi:ribosomal protein S18 acetylase RimI-like enzyme